MEFTFEGKRALITGAGRGLGRVIAKAMWIRGAETFALDKTQEDLDTLKEECPGIHILCVDISNWSNAQTAVGSILPVDLLVNNAAVARFCPLLEVSEGDYDAMLDVNLKAVLAVTQTVAKDMVARKYAGKIVNISSNGSTFAAPNCGIYCAAKGGVDQLTRCMAVEFGPYGIHVNSVNPGLMAVGMGNVLMEQFPAMCEDMVKARYPMGRCIFPEEVADAVLYLLSDKSNMINGARILVDGGATCT